MQLKEKTIATLKQFDIGAKFSDLPVLPKASVLIPLFVRGDELHTLMTLRSEEVAAHRWRGSVGEEWSCRQVIERWRMGGAAEWWRVNGDANRWMMVGVIHRARIICVQQRVEAKC